MILVVGGVVIEENLNIVLLPRAGDKISITDINGNKLTYTVTDVEFSFIDEGYKTSYNDDIQYKSVTIVNAV